MRKITVVPEIVALIFYKRISVSCHDSEGAMMTKLTGRQGLLEVLFCFTVALAVFVSFLAQVRSQELPSDIEVRGATTVQSLHAEGVQIYECKLGDGGTIQWKFREPLATLIDNGKTVGRHFAGPGWELIDGSQVTGKVIAQASGKTTKDIPWLRLEVVAHGGQGAMSPVTDVQRLNTQGGIFAGACSQAGDIHLEPYSADYVFLKR
jgi:Protein of unknown function (DUF3455)